MQKLKEFKLGYFVRMGDEKDCFTTQIMAESLEKAIDHLKNQNSSIIVSTIEELKD